MDATMPAKQGEYGEHDSSKADAPTVEIDPSQLGGKEYKAGEMIQLKVVGHTSEGMLQCECVHDGDGDKGEWEKDFDQSMAEPSGDTPPAEGEQ